MMDETKIHVYDNVMSDHDSQMISDIMSDTEFRWQYYHKSDPDQLVYHWHRLAGRTKKEITDNGFEWLLPMWDHFMYKYKFKDIYGIDTFRRIYFNAHTFGIEPRPHTDDGDFTMIYYPLMDWRKDWGGGTIIWNEDDTKIEKHVAYTGNRLMVFPAKRLHQAQPIHIDCFRLRSCIVFKCFKTEVDDARLDYYQN